MKLISVILTGLLLALTPVEAGEPTLQSHTPGIWSIKGTDTQDRWIVIHNREEAIGTGIYHIEVIGRTKGAPAWKITRIKPHMAITETALRRSIFKPLNKGAVYPEAYDDAYREWTLQKEKGTEVICTTSVLNCLGAG